MRRFPQLADRWAYEWGVVTEGISRVWQRTQDQTHLDYIRRNVDSFVDPSGAIRTYAASEHNLDRIQPGSTVLTLYRRGGEDRYRRAASAMREQLRTQPRTASGGFWHKQIYPHQMWLDGIYMACPFYATFARTFGEAEAFDDVVHQITLIAERTRDQRTGLLRHGWDESRQQRWADRNDGRSSCVWGRGMGWFLMALVDVLAALPSDHGRRGEIRAILRDVVNAIADVQDPATAVWWQVLDQGGRQHNYLEASASCMFIYAIAKGVRQGDLAAERLEIARRAFAGVLELFIRVDAEGDVDVGGICAVAGLGGDPYRDGSYEYYVSEPVVSNDYKGLGAFLLASVEMELAGLS
jgi:unsaturated rhamnogalacturonyl hydrolase